MTAKNTEISLNCWITSVRGTGSKLSAPSAADSSLNAPVELSMVPVQENGNVLCICYVGEYGGRWGEDGGGGGGLLRCISVICLFFFHAEKSASLHRHQHRGFRRINTAENVWEVVVKSHTHPCWPYVTTAAGSMQFTV